MSDGHQEITRVLDAYRAAVLAKDVDAFVALYDDDVHIFDAWAEWSYDGLRGWRAMAESWFESLGTERVIAEPTDVKVLMEGDIAVLHAFVRYTALSAAGEELRALDDRLTWALRRKDGVWKIVHAHTSLPIEHGTAKAIFRR